MSATVERILKPSPAIKTLENQIKLWKNGLNTKAVKVLHVTRYIGLATAVIGALGALTMTGVFLATTLPVAVPITCAVVSVAGLAVYIAVHLAPNIRAYDDAKNGDADRAPTKDYLEILERGARNIPLTEEQKQKTGQEVVEERKRNIKRVASDLYLTYQTDKILNALLDPTKRDQVKKYVGDFNDCFKTFLIGSDDAAKEAAVEGVFGHLIHLNNYPLISLLNEGNNRELMGKYCDGLQTATKEALLSRIDYLRRIEKALSQDLTSREEVRFQLMLRAEEVDLADEDAIKVVQR